MLEEVLAQEKTLRSDIHKILGVIENRPMAFEHTLESGRQAGLDTVPLVMERQKQDLAKLDGAQKDRQILEQGQRIIALKNLIREFEARELHHHKDRQIMEVKLRALQEDKLALSRLFREKVQKAKEEQKQQTSQRSSYERIAAELREDNSRLLADLEKSHAQIGRLQDRLRVQELETAKAREKRYLQKELDTSSHDKLSLALYKANKELELLKQTILELTHQTRTRKTEEARMLTQKNEEFDEKMKELTAAHTKKQLELEYQIQELKQENQGLTFDLTQFKEKEKQMLENIKNQFSQLL